MNSSLKNQAVLSTGDRAHVDQWVNESLANVHELLSGFRGGA